MDPNAGRKPNADPSTKAGTAVSSASALLPPPPASLRWTTAAAASKPLLESLFTAAVGFQTGKRKPPSKLEGKEVALCFFEASTRTRFSFEIAAQRLGLRPSVFHGTQSSTEKGESLVDTGRTLQAMGFSALVVRHTDPGAPAVLAENLSIPVISAGDGMAEHPTQAYLDWFTMQQRFGRLDGLRVLLVGDVAHSRVAHSLLYGRNFGVRLSVASPPSFLPEASRPFFEREFATLDEAITAGDFDVCYALRPQKERFGANQKLSEVDYRVQFLVDEDRLARFPRDAVLMAPGPVVLGIDVTSGAARDSKRSLIETQVTNGVWVRMAVLEAALAGEGA